MTKISVTRALAELKTLSKRIEKLTNQTRFVTWKVVGRNVETNVEKASSGFQSITDLITRYNLIKRSIIESNNNTKVVISGVTYTVSEAIAKKDTIGYDENLLNVLRQQRTEVLNSLTYHDRDVQRKLDNLLSNSFNNNKGDSDIGTITDAFLNSNKAEMIDPLGIEKRIETLENEIESFRKEVDFVLSESNAVTQIDV